ncbi:MAG: hypothetical protein E7266_07085 [Lachnospiraceae bacterium]|nr:hypothetical protein [Lachnospiraceae bacterium]
MVKSQNKYINLIIILILSVCIFLTGCAKNSMLVEDTGFVLYFTDADGTKLITKSYEPVEGDTISIVENLTEELKKNSFSSTSVFAGSVDVKSIELNDGKLKVVLNKEYETLKIAQKLFFRAALVLTYTQVTGVESVEFFVNEETVKYNDGTVIGPLDSLDFIDINNANINNYSTQNLTLYFSNSDGSKLKKTMIECVCYDNVSIERYVIEHLIKGTKEEGYLSTLSGETKINNIVTKDGVCYVDFAKNIGNEVAVSSDVVVYSIVNSLSELNHITKVQISVDGETDIIYGNIDLSETLSRNLDMVESGIEGQKEE